MARIVGYVKSIDGEFIAKAKGGFTRELKVGDPIFTYDHVYDPRHDTSCNIVIDLVGTNQNLQADGKAELVFDDTVTDSTAVDIDLSYRRRMSLQR